MSLIDKHYARIQLWGKTKEEWNNENPILLENEIGIEKDTKQFKIGDGIKSWIELPYQLASNVIPSPDGSVEISLLGDKIEIVDKAIPGNKSVLNKSRIYLQSGQQKSYLDVTGLFSINENGQTTLHPTGFECKGSGTFLSRLNSTSFRLQKDLTNFMQIGFDSTTNNTYMAFVQNQNNTHYLGYDSVSPFIGLEAAGASRNIEFESIFCCSGSLLYEESEHDFYVYDNNQYNIYAIQLLETDIGKILQRPTAPESSYGCFVASLDSLDNRELLGSLGGSLDPTQDLIIPKRAKYFVYDLPSTVSQLTYGITVGNGHNQIYLRPSEIFLKNIETNNQMSLTFNTNRSLLPFLRLSNTERDSLVFGVDEVAYLHNDTRYSWFKPNEFLINPKGKYAIYGVVNDNNTSSALHVGHYGSNYKISLQSNDTSQQIKLVLPEGEITISLGYPFSQDFAEIDMKARNHRIKLSPKALTFYDSSNKLYSYTANGPEAPST